MSDLRDLYQEVILDHNKRPRNKGAMVQPTSQAAGVNPLCGDRVTVYLEVKDGIIEDVMFDGIGCAISTASASLMTDAVKGLKVEEAEKLFESFHKGMTEDPGALESVSEDHPELMALGGVWEFPVRVKCATLAWHAMHAALSGEREVSTE
ncbi:MAG: SUF system NifU family Fe-S cluster assembly protein [Armatimonadetes bacterium]|nr:SUF system NifU family Fe-S cluster assembly protein [Armatimonadota bacterium]